MDRFRNHWRWVATAVYLLFFVLTLTGLRQKSPTFDEQGFITRGLGYVRGQNQHMRVGHPLGLNALNAAFLAFDDQVALPLDDSSWGQTSFHRPSELFMWEIGNDVARILFLARLPTVFLGMLLTAVAGRWAKELTRSRWAGLLAMLLLALDPNILAHSQLATTDLGLTAAALLAGYLLWRFWRQPSWTAAIWAGVGFGLLQNTKFTAGLFVPLFALVILAAVVGLWRENGRFPTKPLLQFIIAYPLSGFLTLWAAYGFQVGTLPANLPTFPQLSGLTLPLSHHLEQLLDIGGRLQKSTPSFLWGQYSDSGWWTYFPAAFLLKTPLPALFLLGWTAVALFLRRLRHDSLTLAALLIPSLGYFGIALTTDVNLGYRHILPVLPYLSVLTAVTLIPLLQTGKPHRWLAGVIVALVGWLAVTTIWLAPDFLAFFNRLAGGPDGGWRYLVDSNLDWGQDLGGLKPWMDENQVPEIWLSYFGEARPEYYDIAYTGLDSFPPRLMNAQARPFYPHDPAPGIYAISATNLQGVHFADHDQFAWFRSQEPVAKIGYSLFIYDVPAYSDPVDLVLSGVQVEEISQDDFARFGTNDVILHWVDLSTAFLQPANDFYWLVVNKDEAVHFFFSEWVSEYEKISETEAYLLFRVESKERGRSILQTFSQNDHQVSLVDFSIPSESLPGSSLMVVTQWQNQSPPAPMKLFVHLVDSEANVLAQWDGLSVVEEGFLQGDLLIQIQQFDIPQDLPSGSYQIRVGIYHPETEERWTTSIGADFVVLGEIAVP